MIKTSTMLLVAIFLHTLQPSQAKQIHKCIDEGGVISYQETACVEKGETMLEKRGVVDAESYQKSLKAISGRLGSLKVSMVTYNWWKVFRKELSDNRLHFKFTDDSGDTPITLLIDFIVPEAKSYLTEKNIRILMKGKVDFFLKTSVETKINLKSMKVDGGFGFYQTFTDENLLGKKGYPPGEFLYTTSGVMVLNDVLINFTLLSNNYTAQNHLSALGFVRNGTAIEQAAAEEPEFGSMTYFEQGLLAFLENRVVESVEFLRLGTTEEPENPETWLAYCMSLREVNRLQSAYIACDKASQMKPNDLKLQHSMLNLMIKARDLKSAFELSKKLIERSESEAIVDTIINLGFFAMLDKQLELATDTFELLSRRGIDSLKLKSDLTVLLYMKGHNKQALQVIDEMLQESDEAKDYSDRFKKKVEAGEDFFPPHYNEESYVVLPKRLKKLGTGELVGQKADAWIKHMIPVRGVGLLQVTVPVGWAIQTEFSAQSAETSVLALKAFEPTAVTKMVAINLGKVSEEWQLSDLEKQLRSTLKAFFGDEQLNLKEVSGQDEQGYEVIKTLSEGEVDLRVLHKETLNGVINLGVNITEVNGDEKDKEILNKVFNSIKLLKTHQAPLNDDLLKAGVQNTNSEITGKSYNEVKLPEAPNGYSWVRMPKAKAAFLKPEGWYEINKSTNDAVTYAISKEKISKQEQFDTGLTVIAAPKITEKARMSAFRYALDMVLAIESDPDNKVIKQDVKKQGPFDSVFIKYENAPTGKQPIIVHKMFICNENTGSMYMVIFEAPKHQWNEAWKIGEVMLKKYLVDDEF